MSEWKCVTIGDFLTERKGKYKPGNEEISDLQRVDKIDFSGNIHLSDKDSKTDLIKVCPGDLLISGINVAKGAVAVFHGEKPVVATIHYSAYIFDEKLVSIGYFRRFVRSPLFEKNLKEQVRGGIKTEIKPKDFLPLQINLPDIRTQNLIVKYFQNIECEISELLDGANAQACYIKQLRQALLQEAVEGKLTAEWRKLYPVVKGNPQYDAAALLAQIRTEKERLVQEGKIRKEKTLSPIANIDKPFDLPTGWVWCYPVELGSFIGGGTPNTGVKEYWDGNIPWVTPKDMKVDEIYDSELKITESGVRNSNATLLPSNTPVFVVRSGILKRTLPISISRVECTINQDLKAWLLTMPKLVDFVKITVKGSETRILNDVVKKGMTVESFDFDKFKIYPFPLPPLAEQQAIVARVDGLMATIDALETQVAKRKEQAQMLMQAVLREAFDGRSADEA